MGRPPNDPLRRRDIEFKLSFEEMKYLLRKWRQYSATSMEGKITQAMMTSFRRYCEKLYKAHKATMPPAHKIIMEDAIEFYDEQVETVDDEVELMEELGDEAYVDERAVAQAIKNLPSTEFPHKPYNYWKSGNDETEEND